MFELEINGTMYQFNFGIGFVREINKNVKKDENGLMIDTSPLAYTIAYIYDGDVVTISKALFIANKGCDPRLTEKEIDAYLDDPDTDIDDLIERLMDFFGKNNATKRACGRILKMIETTKAVK